MKQLHSSLPTPVKYNVVNIACLLDVGSAVHGAHNMTSIYLASTISAMKVASQFGLHWKSSVPTRAPILQLQVPP